MPYNKIFEIFEILIEKLNNEIEAVKKSGEMAIEKDDLTQASNNIETAKKLKNIKDKFKKLMDEWKKLTSSYPSMETIPPNNTDSESIQIQRSQSTLQTAYILPILQVLDENYEKGKGRAKDILDEVFNKMKNKLKPADIKNIPSGTSKRWRKNANFARFIMVRNLGLLKNDSPRGFWEISEKGRQHLSTIAKPEASSPPIRPVTSSVSTRKPISYPEGSYINKRIRSFQLLGKAYHPRTWKELLVLVSEEMYRRHSAEFSRCLSLRGSRMSYFSQQPNELSRPMQIAGSIFFVETKLNANSIVKRSRDLIGLFDYEESDIQVSAE